MRSERGDASLIKWFRETHQSELLIIAVEDISALAGSAIAFVSILATMLTGNAMWDAMGSVVIAVVLMGTATLVLIEVKSLIVGESASPKVRKGIHSILKGERYIAEVRSLITMQWGDGVAVAIEARMKTEGISATELVNRIQSIEDRVKHIFPQVKWVFLSSEMKGPAESRPMLIAA